MSAPAAAIRRYNAGSGHWYEVDGRKADGVTSLISKGMPKQLQKWAAEKTANYALDHWDELSALPLSERLKLMMGAQWADLAGAANRGKRVHHLGQQLASGAEIDVPEDLAGYVESYLAFLNDWEPDPLLVETTVANRAVHYAGTLDLLARVRFARAAEQEIWLFDIKTGNRVYGDTALQLAAYAYAEVYVAADGSEHPMPDVQAAAVVHVRSDGYSVYRLPLDGGVFNIFRHVAFVARSVEPMRNWVSDPLVKP